MTTINTFEDILAAMDRDPQLREAMRQHVLGEELRQLPAIVQELREAVAELAQTVRDYMVATNTRLDRLEAGQAEANARLDRLEAGQAEANARLDRLEAGQAEANARLDRLEAGQAEANARLDRLEAGQAEANARLDRLEAGQARIEERQDRMETDIKELKSDMADVKGQLVPLAAHRMVGRIADVTQSRRPRWMENTEIIDISDDADTSDVPPNELESFRAIDLAMRAVDKNRPGNHVQYIVIECTSTITRNDVTRAARNAEYMTRFTGAPAKAVVIGHSIPDAIAALAQERAVHCITVTNKSTRPR